MFLGILILLTGLTISAVAIYYSVLGLAAIFAAATIPIYIMGTTLEVAKLVGASWLKSNWTRAPGFIKYYMSVAVLVLMMITSMGIFGFLSKAHGDQTLVSGDVAAQVAIIDEKIKTEKENIDANRKALKQLDEAVDQVMARSTTEAGAGKSVQIRRSQQADRNRISKEIEASQKAIGKYNAERAPISATLRKVEAEVGPIKYIAAFVYGANPDANLLEKAVTWVIILIVGVFDPLAIAMLLAAQMSFKWAKDEKAAVIETPHVVELVGDTPSVVPASEAILQEEVNLEDINQQLREAVVEKEYEYIVEEPIKVKNTDHEPFDFDKHPYLFKPLGDPHPPGIDPIGPVVYKPDAPIEVTEEFAVDSTVEGKAAELIVLQEDDLEILKKKSYMIKQGSEQIVKTIN